MLQPQDTGRVQQLWLEGNLDAHAFVPGNYWCEKVSMVRELLLQAEVYVYEQNGEIQGFVGLQGDMIAGIFVDRLHRSGGDWETAPGSCETPSSGSFAERLPEKFICCGVL